MRGSHPLPDQLPGEHTGPQSTSGTDPLFPTAFSAAIHTHSHMLTVDRSMVVGHVLTVHTCSFMCTNHIDMIKDDNYSSKSPIFKADNSSLIPPTPATVNQNVILKMLHLLIREHCKLWAHLLTPFNQTLLQIQQ